MDQQIKDFKFCDYDLASPESVVTNPVLRDMHTVDTPMLPQSGQLTANKGALGGESIKTPWVKRISNDCPLNTSQPQSLPSKTSSRNLVYVRRKPDTEPGWSKISGCQHTGINCQKVCDINHQNESAPEKSKLDTPVTGILGGSQVSLAASVGLSSGKPSMSESIGKSDKVLSSANLNHPKSNPVLSCPAELNHLWQERYSRLQKIRLQKVLKLLDESDQHYYCQMLRSLSSVELSRLAVELEKRSIQLSLVEAKELNRVKLFGVMEKYSEAHERMLSKEHPPWLQK